MARSSCAFRFVLSVAAALWGIPLQAQVANGAIPGPATALPAGASLGELLIGELNCVACHQAEASVKTRLFSRESPRLGEEGLRLTPQYVRAFLTNPSAEKRGTTMPDLLHTLDPKEKAETVDALVHFLCSRYSANSPATLGRSQSVISQGRSLYHQVGCVACHSPQEATNSLDASSVPLGDLAKKTTIDELSSFLKDPLKTRPSGRMPSMSLSGDEAAAIAIYLLRDQPIAANLTPIRGLTYQYVEGDFSDTIKLDAATPKTNGITDQFSFRPTGKRIENVGLRFEGLLNIVGAGKYTFYTASDDGSRLYLDDQLVVDNDGHHATVEKSGAIDLTAGVHPIRVSYFNNDGARELRVSYQGPGLPKQEIPPSALFHLANATVPTEEENFVPNTEKANRGKELFTSLGCAACHALHHGVPALAGQGNPPPAIHPKPLANLDPTAADSCLNLTPRTAPIFDLSDSQREATRIALAHSKEFVQPLTPTQQVARTMAALNCLGCHSRDGVGGPAAVRADYFKVIGEADLGDEGRFPPHLTRVGDKLRLGWLREVLVNKGTARPYMATRMPQFGEANVGHLVEAFGKVDSPPRERDAIAPPSSLQEAGYGHKFVGTEGLSCIACHTFAGHKSLGIPAMDLTLMTQRLQKDWFHRYLLDPPSLRPGTRMPSFWPEGKSAFKDLLDGDSDRQIDAIWAYLSRGKEAGLPVGLVQGKMELVASNEAVIYRNFIQGAGSRGIGVAYPEKANLAFDANELRLALIWQGPFIDAARHRSGRGEGFEGPLGYNVVKMPAGAPFAVLGDTTAKWPEAVGKKAGYQMRGYRLDAKRRPTFLYSCANIQIEDYPIAVSGVLDASLRRTLTVQADHAVEKLWFRAWSGAKVEAQSDGSFLADGKVKLSFPTGATKPIIRQSDGKSELLVPVAFSGNQAKIVEEVIW